MNQITHWLDNSNIYGSNEEESEELREGRSGLLKVTKISAGTNTHAEFLPKCLAFDNEPDLSLIHISEPTSVGGKSVRTALLSLNDKTNYFNVCVYIYIYLYIYIYSYR